MLKNQLALTEGLRANQRSNTHGFSQLERFADMRELPGAEATEDEDDYKTAASSSETEPDTPEEKKNFNLASRFKDEQIEYLKKGGYDDPNNLLTKDYDYLESYFKDVNRDVKTLNGRIVGKEKKKIKLNKIKILLIKQKWNEIY